MAVSGVATRGVAQSGPTGLAETASSTATASKPDTSTAAAKSSAIHARTMAVSASDCYSGTRRNTDR